MNERTESLAETEFAKSLGDLLSVYLEKPLGKYYIYYHVDPRNQMPMYVGKGSRRRAYNMYHRSEEHKIWIAELKKESLKPIIYICNRYDNENEIFEIEKSDIRVIRALNPNLLNKNKGGKCSGYRSCEKAIVCLNTGILYDSIVDAADFLAIQPQSISSVLTGRKNSYKGLFFRYHNDKLNKIPDARRKKREKNKERFKKISLLCVETGAVYKSIYAAAKHLKCDRSQIHNFLNGIGGIKKVKGYTFRRI